MEKDKLTIIIETLLKMIKPCALVITNDDKYSLYLKKVNISTNGKSYEIVISDREWKSYEDVNEGA